MKRRKVDDENAATALRHLNLAKSRIKRARVLHEPLTGGFFAREYGAMEDDMQAACFVDGLRNKGSIPISPGMQVKRMCVTGSDYKTGMSTVFAGMSLAAIPALLLQPPLMPYNMRCESWT